MADEKNLKDEKLILRMAVLNTATNIYRNMRSKPDDYSQVIQDILETAEVLERWVLRKNPKLQLGGDSDDVKNG